MIWSQSSGGWKFFVLTDFESVKCWCSLDSLTLQESTIHTLGAEMQWPGGCPSFCQASLCHSWGCHLCMHGSVHKAGQKLLFQLVGNQPYMVPRRAKQWTLLDLWIFNPFSPAGLEPGCSACTIGLAQVDPTLARWCFAMQNPRPRMACHAWQWHLLDFWHLLHGHIVAHLVLLAVLGIFTGLTWLLHTLVPLAGSRLGDSKLWKLSKCLGPKTWTKQWCAYGSILVIWKHCLLNVKALGAECGNRKARKNQSHDGCKENQFA